MERRGAAKALAWGGSLALVLFEILLFSGAEWVRVWFYLLAWWSFIPLVDGLVYLKKGNSLILSRTREFAILVPTSALLWLVFELANFRLGNWHYVGIEPRIWIRWPGYAVAFATVLPGIFEVYELLSAYGLFEKRFPPARIGPGVLRLFAGIGWAFLVLPLAFPRAAFPLVWGAFVFLLEPGNYRRGLPSLLRDAEEGRAGRFFRILAAGAVCGLLWEFWNFWSVAKWRYTVPGLDELKLFEMPVAGFLGFPPFALECWVIGNFLGRFRGGRTWEGEPPSGGGAGWSRALWAAAWTAAILFWLGMSRGIDLFTVRTFR